ncbi:alpha/beta fold hydrolase [Bradyrhizobium sp. Ai1a-2]|uniref:alpha/beta fold hydrolase n=1 Tax=Bradyrhizobium sp. Ai1a-2 TaxID=196490 RepID=UPI0004036C0F|nr:alpha/beta fold hydrolase [Bradyrhizobium sp. Ai1a-2]
MNQIPHIAGTSGSDDYTESFSRNIGILTAAEQNKLARTIVAIAGLGGVGGNVLMLLARMGIGRFRLAEFDRFERVNINRQPGATSDTIGELKCEVLLRQVKAINPSAEIELFPQGFTPDVAAELLDGVDIAVDAIDFYAIDAHLGFHREARRRGLYILMGSAVGFSGCLQVFDPNGMDIENYCGIEPSMSTLEKQLRYACGIVPELLHIEYFDVSRGTSNTDVLKNTGPSLAVACSLGATLVATEVVLIVLARRRPLSIPHTCQFDPYTRRYAYTHVPGGMRHFDPRPAIARIPDKSSFVPRVLEFLYRDQMAERASVNGAELRVKVEGSGPPVLLISPLGADSSFWLRQVPALTPHFQVITFGSRGAAESSPATESCSTELLAEDAITLLEHLRVSRTHIVGLALGSLVAQRIAWRRPDLVDRLVLAAGYVRPDAHIEATTRSWREVAADRGMEDLFDTCLEWLFSAAYLASRDREIDKLKAIYRLTHQDVTSFCGQSLAGVRHDAGAWIGQISCPTLIVHGADDRLVVPSHAQLLASSISGAQLALIDGAPHFLSWEYAPRLNDEIIGFLQA